MGEELEKVEEKRQGEVAAALERGEIAEPFSMSAFLISLAVSAATTAASYVLSRVFAPKLPTRREGQMTGSIQVMQSEQGLMIPEVYGRDPGYDAWAAGTAYTAGQTRRPTSPNGYFYTATNTATSGGTEPGTWPTTVGATVSDGGVTWRNDGRVGGGARFAPIIPWTTGLRPHREVSRQEVGGGKGPPRQTQTVETITYDLDVALEWSRGEAKTLAIFANTDTIFDQRVGRTSGLLDDNVIEDDDYDQDDIPDTNNQYLRPIDRHNGALDVDVNNVGTGTILQGAYAAIADYPGSMTQPVDPTIQADLDTEFGANSTPAFRGRHYTKLAGFFLTRWGGILPNFTGIHQNETIRTLEDLCDHLCERVGMESGDYDFSALSGIYLRGLLIAGRRYQPKEVLEICARVFNFYFCETVDGQLVGRLQDEEPILEIDDTEIGWIENEPEDDQPLPELDTTVPNEIILPRRVDVKYVDPEKEFEPNLQTASRQITTGVDEQVLEVQITMLAEEAREVAQRELYQEYVEGTKHGFTLPWTYLYLDPGRVVQINRAEGFSHYVRVPSIKGGISLLNCSGYAVETAVFTQPVSTSGGSGFEQPPVPIPAMTVMVLLDVPLLRDADATVNNGLGFYWGATPRTGDDQVWQGAVLYVSKVGWEQIAHTTLPATIGKVVSFANLTYVTNQFDTTGEFVVDLYGETATLESAAEPDVLNGANAGLFGQGVIQWKTAERVSGFPNRWKVTGLLHGRRGAPHYSGLHAVGERFVLLNEAVQFVPISAEDLNVERTYRAVTFGQSLDDAANVPFACEGKSAKPPAPVGAQTFYNTKFDNTRFGDKLTAWERAARVAPGLHNFSESPVSQEQEVYMYQVMDGANVKNRFFVSPDEAVNVMWRVPRWISINAATLRDYGGANLSIVGAAIFYSAVESVHTFRAPFRLEFDLAAIDGTITTRLGVYPLNRDINSAATPDFWIELSASGARAEGLSSYVAFGERSRLSIVGREGGAVEYYLDYSDENSRPFYTSTKNVTLRSDYKVACDSVGNGVDSGSQVIYAATLKTPQPAFCYTRLQQIADWGAPQTVTVRISQMSQIGGQGEYVELTI